MAPPSFHNPHFYDYGKTMCGAHPKVTGNKYSYPPAHIFWRAVDKPVPEPSRQRNTCAILWLTQWMRIAAYPARKIGTLSLSKFQSAPSVSQTRKSTNGTAPPCLFRFPRSGERCIIHTHSHVMMTLSLQAPPTLTVYSKHEDFTSTLAVSAWVRVTVCPFFWR